MKTQYVVNQNFPAKKEKGLGFSFVQLRRHTSESWNLVQPL